MRPQQLIQQWLLTLLQFPLRRSMVSHNENQKAVVAQELGSFADVAQKCQWRCPFGKRKLRDRRRDGKSMGYTFQILTTSLMPPSPKSKHSNLKTGQCYRNIQLLSSDSIPTVSDWMLNFMQSLQIPGKQAGLPWSHKWTKFYSIYNNPLHLVTGKSPLPRHPLSPEGWKLIEARPICSQSKPPLQGKRLQLYNLSVTHDLGVGSKEKKGKPKPSIPVFPSQCWCKPGDSIPCVLCPFWVVRKTGFGMKKWKDESIF